MFRGRCWRSRRASVANPGAELERDYSCAHAATTASPLGAVMLRGLRETTSGPRAIIVGADDPRWAHSKSLVAPSWLEPMSVGRVAQLGARGHRIERRGMGE